MCASSNTIPAALGASGHNPCDPVSHATFLSVLQCWHLDITYRPAVKRTQRKHVDVHRLPFETERAHRQRPAAIDSSGRDRRACPDPLAANAVPAGGRQSGGPLAARGGQPLPRLCTQSACGASSLQQTLIFVSTECETIGDTSEHVEHVDVAQLANVVGDGHQTRVSDTEISISAVRVPAAIQWRLIFFVSDTCRLHNEYRYRANVM